MVVIFTVANLAAMGLELSVRQTLEFLRSPRLLTLTFFWGWVVWSIPEIVDTSETSAFGCEFNWSLQHMPEISLPVFRILTFFSGVRSTAAPLY